MTTKSLYSQFKDTNLIKSEKYLITPQRDREKACGFMWEGKMEVILQDDLRFVFFFWHHCYNDTGGSWYPSQLELDSFWGLKFVPATRIPMSELVDAYWHCIYFGTQVYITTTGFFLNDQYKDEIVRSIEIGTWYTNSDLWLLI